MKHEMTLNYYMSDDGIHLECSCGLDVKLGFTVPVEQVVEEVEKHNESNTKQLER